jgi:hypothetical protein
MHDVRCYSEVWRKRMEGEMCPGDDTRLRPVPDIWPERRRPEVHHGRLCIHNAVVELESGPQCSGPLALTSLAITHLA